MINTSLLVLESEISPQVFPINRELLKQYAAASGDQNPIHQDEDFAKSVGLPDVIAHGMLTMGLVGTYLTNNFGVENIQEFSVRFVKPVVVPKDIDVILRVTGKVSELSESGIKIEITASVEESKVLGKAFAVIKRN